MSFIIIIIISICDLIQIYIIQLRQSMFKKFQCTPYSRSTRLLLRYYCKKSGPHFAFDVYVKLYLSRHPMQYNNANYVK